MRYAAMILALAVAACSKSAMAPPPPPAHDPIILVMDSTQQPAIFLWSTRTGLSGVDTLQPGASACVKFIAIDSVWIDYKAHAYATDTSNYAEVGPGWLWTPGDTVPPNWTVDITFTYAPLWTWTYVGYKPVALPPC